MDDLNKAVAELTEKIGAVAEDASKGDLQKAILDLTDDIKKVSDIVNDMSADDMKEMAKDDETFKGELENLNEAVGNALADLQKLQ